MTRRQEQDYLNQSRAFVLLNLSPMDCAMGHCATDEEELLGPLDTETIRSCDAILREVYPFMAKAQRAKFITESVKTAPSDDICLLEWIEFVAILLKAGSAHFDVHSELVILNSIFYGVCYDYELDAQGHIVCLRISCDLNFDLDGNIQRLKHLQKIELVNCFSVPKELSSLAHLEILHLDNCSDLVNRWPVDLRLDHLRELRIMHTRIWRLSPFLWWMSTKLPRLESLDVLFGAREDASRVIHALYASHTTCSFRDTLRKLYLSWHLEKHHLDILLFGVLPRFPNMSHLHVDGIEKKSILSVVEKVRSGACPVVSKSIRYVKITGPRGRCLSFGREEKASILEFLRIFHTISVLNGVVLSDPAIEHALRINCAGRRLIEGGGRAEDPTESIPLSVWPTVLARAHKCADHWGYETTPDGLYYLLRNGLVYQLASSTTTRSSSSSSNSASTEAAPMDVVDVVPMDET